MSSPARRTVRATPAFFADLPRPIPGRDDPGRDDYRVLITTGRLVAAVAVVGQLAADGAVELVELDVDTSSPDVDLEADD